MPRVDVSYCGLASNLEEPRDDVPPGVHFPVQVGRHQLAVLLRDTFGLLMEHTPRFQAEYLSLDALFAASLYRVPDYQRGYAWDDTQLLDLWRDVQVVRSDTREPPVPHFTGMITVRRLRDETDPVDGTRLVTREVIDGQQRLTTIVLWMAILANRLRETGDPDDLLLADELTDRFVARRGALQRLSSSVDRLGYLAALLGSTPGTAPEPRTASNRRLAHAHRWLSDEVSELVATAGATEGHAPNAPRSPAATLRSLADALRTRLHFVRFEVPSAAEAGVIFEVTNNRGVTLSEADKVKNHHLYVAHRGGGEPAFVDALALRWGRVFANIDRAAGDSRNTAPLEDRALRTHWILYREPTVPRSERRKPISRRIHEIVDPRTCEQHGGSPTPRARLEHIDSYSTHLERVSAVIAELYRPDERAFRDVPDVALRHRILEAVETFTRMRRIATVLPLLVAARVGLGDRHADFLHVAQRLEAYCVRSFVICNRRAGAGSSAFARVAKNLYWADASTRDERLAAALATIDGRLDAYGPDERVGAALLDRGFFHAHSPTDIRFLFFEWEKHLGGRAGAEYTWKAFADGRVTQVEHVFSQNGRRKLGGNAATHDANVHRLGNLTITRVNQALSNKTFEAKRPIYRESNLRIERACAEFDTWTLDVLDQREAELVDFVKQRWPARSQRPDS